MEVVFVHKREERTRPAARECAKAQLERRQHLRHEFAVRASKRSLDRGCDLLGRRWLLVFALGVLERVFKLLLNVLNERLAHVLGYLPPA